MGSRGSSNEGAVIDTTRLGKRSTPLGFRTGVLKGKRGAFQCRFIGIIIITITITITSRGGRGVGIEGRSVLARGAGSVHEADGMARIAELDIIYRFSTT